MLPRVELNVELIVPAIEKMVDAARDAQVRQFVRDVRAITGAPNAAKAISSVKDIFAARAEGLPRAAREPSEAYFCVLERFG